MSFKEKYIKYKNKYLKLKNLLGGNRLIDVGGDKITHCNDFNYFEQNYDSCMTFKNKDSNNSIFIVFDFQSIDMTFNRKPDECDEFWFILQLLNINPTNIYMFYPNKQIKNCFDTQSIKLQDNILNQIKKSCPNVGDMKVNDSNIQFPKEKCNLFYKYVIQNPKQFQFLQTHKKGDSIQPIITDFINHIISKLTLDNKNIVIITRGHTGNLEIGLRNEQENITIENYYNLLMKPFYDKNIDIVLNMIHLQCENLFFAEGLNNYINGLIKTDNRDRKYIGIVDKINFNNFPLFAVQNDFKTHKDFLFGTITDINDLIGPAIAYNDNLTGVDYANLEPEAKKKFEEDSMILIKKSLILINYIKNRLKINLTLDNFNQIRSEFNSISDLYGTNSLFLSILNTIEKYGINKVNTWDILIKKIIEDERSDLIWDQAVNQLIIIIQSFKPTESKFISDTIKADFNKFLNRGIEKIIFYSNSRTNLNKKLLKYIL